MARRPQRESAEDRAIRELDAEDEDTLRRLAFESGPPPDSEQLSPADEDAAWEITDPAVDSEQFPTMLMTSGLPPEMLQSLRVLKVHPEWAELYGKPTQDAEKADLLTRLAEFPWRWSLLLGTADPDEQVRKAETLAARYQKKHADMRPAPAIVEPPPMPPVEMPMPEMQQQEPAPPLPPAPAAPPMAPPQMPMQAGGQPPTAPPPMPPAPPAPMMGA